MATNILSQVNEPITWNEMGKKMLPITWAWNQWLPNGFLVILAGPSGSGKSTLALRISGCFTNGWDWPDGTPYLGDQGEVLWVEAEAGQAVNLYRANNFGLNITRFLVPGEDAFEDINLKESEHVSRIRALSLRKSVKLIVIDCLRGVNGMDENSSEMHQIVKSLAMIARDSGKPILLIHHLRKRNVLEKGEIGLDMLRGSTAIVQPARLVWVLDNLGSDNSMKRLQVIKSNLAKTPQPIGVTIDENGVEFGVSTEPPRITPVKDQAKNLLNEILKDGPVEQKTIRKKTDDFDIGWRTVTSVKSKLGIQSKRVGGSKGHSIWKLPSK